ncbi:MAG: hypothetical protein IPG79_14925 [Saprospiraceae bacterium]|nr:hypothetical protein [Saprospiraceae bacterium]
MNAISLTMIELQQEYRQTDRKFIRLLDAIRKNTIDYDDMEELNERFVELPEDKDFYITLCSRNDIANSINQRELESLPDKVYEFHGYVEGILIHSSSLRILYSG